MLIVLCAGFRTTVTLLRFVVEYFAAAPDIPEVKWYE